MLTWSSLPSATESPNIHKCVISIRFAPKPLPGLQYYTCSEVLAQSLQVLLNEHVLAGIHYFSEVRAMDWKNSCCIISLKKRVVMLYTEVAVSQGIARLQVFLLLLLPMFDKVFQAVILT